MSRYIGAAKYAKNGIRRQHSFTLNKSKPQTGTLKKTHVTYYISEVMLSFGCSSEDKNT